MLWWKATSATVLTLWLSATAAAADWPTFQFEPGRNAATPEQLQVDQLGQQWLWQSSVPPHSAWDAPARWDAYAGIRGLQSMRSYDRAFHLIAVGDAVYFGSSVDDAVICLDARTGVQRWRFTTDGPVRLAPTHHDGRLYFGSDDGHAYCIAADSGTLIWKFRPGAADRLILNNGRPIPLWPCRTGVAVRDGRAYFACSLLPWRKSYLCAVDAKTGKREGPGCFVREYTGMTMEGPLIASPERLILPQGRVAPQLFARSDGKSQGPLKGGGGSFVVLTDKTILHGPGNKTGWITASNSNTREAIAQFKTATAMVVDRKMAYILSKNSLVASDFVNRKVKWKITVDDNLHHSLILAGDTLFVGGDDQVVAFRAADGRRRWVGPVVGRALALAVAHGRLLVSTDVGGIHAFHASGKLAVRRPQPRSAPAASATPLDPIQPIDDAGLLSRWVFQTPHRSGRTVKDLNGESPATISGPIRTSRVAARQALELDGRGNQVMLTAELGKAKLPTQTFSVAAWVRVDKPLNWGGIIGAIQDDGSVEHGWLLGYRNSTFAFAVRGEKGTGRLTYLTAARPFKPGRWYHVAASYDGKQMKLYVNGTAAGSSNQQQGPIKYPAQGFYEIGAYHDSNEYYRMTGGIHEVRVYRRELTAEEVAAQAKEIELVEPAVARELVQSPYSRFASPTSALVSWETEAAVPSRIRWERQTEQAEEKQSTASTRQHELRIDGLAPNRVYRYWLEVPDGDRTHWAGPYSVDTHFNYAAARITIPKSATQPRDELYRRLARELLKQSGQQRGLCLVVGGGDGRLAFEIAAHSDLTCLVVDTDGSRVEAIRELLERRQVPARQVSVLRVDSLEKLPLTKWTANLIVSQQTWETGRPIGLGAELGRVLRPDGGALVLAVPGNRPPEKPVWNNWAKQLGAALDFRSQNGRWWAVARRGPVAGAGSWTHLYGSADNSAFGGETLQEATRTEDLEVQWVGRPGARYQVDRNGRKPSPLSAGGRLFLQGDQRIIALDAYNGIPLWTLDIPGLARFNMPRDCSNWCVLDGHLYVAVRDRCWKVAVDSGQVRDQFELAATTDETPFNWGYIARSENRLLGSAVRRDAQFTTFWGGAGQGWYDAKAGTPTHKVCSDELFALDAGSGKRRWTYRDGVLINSTITVGDGRVYAVVCRNPEIVNAATRQIGAAGLWQQRFLVAVDLKSGRRVWERPLSTPAGKVVYYLAHGKDKLVMVASGDGQYHVNVFDDQDGKDAWKTRFRWPSDNHGGHMARPALVGNSLYVRPMAFELATGTRYSRSMPGGGCGTYAATTKALFFRSGNVTVWDRLRGETTKWNRLRPDCWLSTIPAGGMLLSPEGGGGCSCGSWMETSLGFAPRRSKP